MPFHVAERAKQSRELKRYCNAIERMHVFHYFQRNVIDWYVNRVIEEREREACTNNKFFCLVGGTIESTLNTYQPLLTNMHYLLCLITK